MRALFVGRFQPLHKGHLHALKRVLREFDFVTIGIGSANNAGGGKNPFTYEERRRMLLLALQGVPLTKFKIIAIPDFFDDVKWTRYVTSHAKFDVVVTGSRWVRRCLKGKAKIVSPNYLQRRTYSATNVRRKIISGKSYSTLVPHKVFAFLKKIRARERLKSIFGMS